MPTAKITGGSITFEDAVKHSPNSAGEYHLTRKASATFAFDLEDGADESAQTLRISDLARAKVRYMLSDDKTPAAADGKASAAPQGKAKPASSAAKGKASSASATPASTTTPAATPGQPSTSEQPSGGSDTASDEIEIDGDAPATPPAGDEIEIPDEVDFNAPIEPEAPDVPAITDADLNAAVTKRNGELKDAVKIRGLIGTFNPDPSKAFTLRELPLDKRADFLDKLAALT